MFTGVSKYVSGHDDKTERVSSSVFWCVSYSTAWLDELVSVTIRNRLMPGL